MSRNGLALFLCGVGALLGACGGSASASDETRTIRIEHSAFRPGSLEVNAGETVRFVVVNDDPIDHEFLIGDLDGQATHESGSEAHHGDKPGEISVAALSSAETTFTFGAPGRIYFGCHLPGHYAFGMKGAIHVR